MSTPSAPVAPAPSPSAEPPPRSSSIRATILLDPADHSVFAPLIVSTMSRELSAPSWLTLI